MYMRFFGADYFIVYDAGWLGSELGALLTPLTRAGILDIADFKGLRRCAMNSFLYCTSIALKEKHSYSTVAVNVEHF